MAELARATRKARLLPVALILASIAIAGPVSGTLAAGPAARAGRVCHAPRLTGLTLAAARVRSKHAGCQVRLKGALLEVAGLQTIQRQFPAPGRRSSSVTVWLNPSCRGSAAYGPDIAEPTVSAGPTELISGFYVVGGPLTLFSTPHCQRPQPEPGAGTVEVIDAAGGLVASATSTQGRLVMIPLPPGSYTMRGTFLGAEMNSAPPIRSEPLVVTAGKTVRRDFFLDAP